MRGFGICRGGGEGKHISLAAIFEETHITSDMCSGAHISRGNTYHCDIAIKVGKRRPRRFLLNRESPTIAIAGDISCQLK